MEAPVVEEPTVAETPIECSSTDTTIITEAPAIEETPVEATIEETSQSLKLSR